MYIILDTFPASSTGKRPGSDPTLLDHCREWINVCETAGHVVMVPAVAYYEVLRELELRDARSQIIRLKAFCLRPDRFIPIATEHLETAARFWAKARRAGKVTADMQALDVDVILAAQALGLGVPHADLIIATTNPSHIAQFAPCNLWTNIQP
jgi:predicted nucleic acid-binding protein